MSNSSTQNGEERKKKQLILLTGGLGGIFVTIFTILGIINVLNALGLSIFEAVSLSSELKISIPLYATMMGLTNTFLIASVYLVYKGFTKYGGSAAILSAVLGVTSVIVPGLYKLNVSQMYLFGGAIGAFLIGVSGAVSATIPQTAKTEFLTLSPLDTSVIAIFSAATAVVTGIVGGLFPSPTGGYTHLGDTVTFIVALLFGPKVGMLTSLIGSVVADFYLAYPRWFVTVLAHGAEGYIAGLGKGRNILIQAVLCALGGVAMAFTYFYINIFIKGYPVALISFMRDIIGQVGVSLVITMLLIKPLERATSKILRK